MANAAYYLLAARDATGSWPVYLWLSKDEAGCGGGTGTCAVTPDVTLVPGDAVWYVQTWNDAGLGPWSGGMPFTVAGALPAKAVQLSPDGSIPSHQPTYVWEAVRNAEWYLLAARDGSGSWPVYLWTSKADAGCGAGTGTCEVTPESALAAGEAVWYVLAWNTSGPGPWSDGMTFTVGPAPGKPAQIAPNSTVLTDRPTYTWEAAANAEWYLVVAQEATGAWPVYLWTSKADAGCAEGPGPCSATPEIPLVAGKAVWYVQAWNPSGLGPWSDGMAFTVARRKTRQGHPGFPRGQDRHQSADLHLESLGQCRILPPCGARRNRFVAGLPLDQQSRGGLRNRRRVLFGNTRRGPCCR